MAKTSGPGVRQLTAAINRAKSPSYKRRLQYERNMLRSARRNGTSYKVPELNLIARGR